MDTYITIKIRFASTLAKLYEKVHGSAWMSQQMRLAVTIKSETDWLGNGRTERHSR